MTLQEMKEVMRDSIVIIRKNKVRHFIRFVVVFMFNSIISAILNTGFFSLNLGSVAGGGEVPSLWTLAR